MLTISGAVLFIVAGLLYTSVKTKTDNWHKTTAVVRELVTIRNSGRYNTYPVFEYTDLSGRSHRYHSRMGSNPPSWREGEATELYYNPASPDDVLIDSFWQKYLMVVILMGAGLIAFTGGIYVSMTARHEQFS